MSRAVRAAGPVLLALGDRAAEPSSIAVPRARVTASVVWQRATCATSAAAVSMAVLAPLALAAPGAFAAGTRGAAVAHNAAGLALRLYAPDAARRIASGVARRRPAARPATDIGAPAGSQPA